MTTLLAKVKAITRFDVDMDGSMEPHEDGAWIRVEDALQAIADEKAKQQPTRTCKTCKFYAVSCHLYEPCLRCTHQAGISDQWEPKP